MADSLVFIDGDQGTTGLQIHQRLRDRSGLYLSTLPDEERKDRQRRTEATNACDIAPLCLLDAAAHEAVNVIVNPSVGYMVSQRWPLGRHNALRLHAGSQT